MDIFVILSSYWKCVLFGIENRILSRLNTTNALKIVLYLENLHDIFVNNKIEFTPYNAIKGGIRTIFARSKIRKKVFGRMPPLNAIQYSISSQFILIKLWTTIPWNGMKTINFININLQWLSIYICNSNLIYFPTNTLSIGRIAWCLFLLYFHKLLVSIMGYFNLTESKLFNSTLLFLLIVCWNSNENWSFYRIHTELYLDQPDMSCYVSRYTTSISIIDYNENEWIGVLDDEKPLLNFVNTP